MEWNRMQAILRPVRLKAVCQRWQTTALRLHFFLSPLSLHCVFHLCTEAPFIHQSSHFPSLFCHYRQTKQKWQQRAKKTGKRCVSSKGKLTKGTKTNIKGVVWAKHKLLSHPTVVSNEFKNKIALRAAKQAFVSIARQNKWNRTWCKEWCIFVGNHSDSMNF